MPLSQLEGRKTVHTLMVGAIHGHSTARYPCNISVTVHAPSSSVYVWSNGEQGLVAGWSGSQPVFDFGSRGKG